MVKDLNRAYSSRPALWSLDHEPRGFEWIDANDAAGNTFSFLRFGEADEDGAVPVVASITNFSGAQHHQYRVGLPHAGRWNEILNTDAESYGGSGAGNLGSVVAEEVPWHGQPCSALVTLPALGAVWLEPAERVVPARTEVSGAARARRHLRADRRSDHGRRHDRRHVAVRGPGWGGVLLRWHVRVRGTGATGSPATTEGVVPAAGSEADASTPAPRRPPVGPARPLPRRRSTTEKE